MLDLHIPIIHLALTAEHETRFRNTLASLGLHMSFRQVVPNGVDRVGDYEAHALKLKAKHGTIWAGIKAEYGPTDGRTPTAWLPWSWSAGSGLMRACLRECGNTLPLELIGYVASDSIYGDDDDPRPDLGTVPEASVAPWLHLAHEAAMGRRVFVVGAGDVPTSYATTRQMVSAIADHVSLALEDRPGGPWPALLREGERRGLLMRWYDAAPGRGTAEHIAFAGDVGAALLQEGAKRALAILGGAAPSEPVEPTLPPPRPAAGLLGTVTPTSKPGLILRVQGAVGAARDGRWGPGTRGSVAACQRALQRPVRAREWADEDQAALEACPIGIDVSHHQPPIDWKRVRQGGYSFAIVRSSYGTSRDMRAVAHAKGAQDAGLAVGGYLFLRPSQDGAVQARLAHDVLGDYVSRWWIDIEQDPFNDEAHHSTPLVESCYRELLCLTGLMPDTYGANWWPYGWDAVPSASEMWVANRTWPLPLGRDRFRIRQVDMRYVPGVRGNCDHDIWFGTEAGMRWRMSGH